MQKRHDVHETLTMISLENKGLEKIIYEFNQMIDQPVSFFNVLENKHYLHHTNQTPNLTMHELNNLFSNNRKPTYVEISKSNPEKVYLYPIYNGTVFLGCFMLHGNMTISESDRMTLEQGSPIVALALIKEQTVTEYFYKKTHEHFQELLEYQDYEHLLKLGKKIGLNISAYWFIAIFEMPKSTDLKLLEMDIHQLILKMKNVLHTTEKMIFGFNNSAIVLVSLTEPNAFHQIQKKFQAIKNEWENSGSSFFRGGISNTYKGLENIRKCYEEANKTLSYLSSRNQNKMMRYEDIGLNQLFINQPSQEIEQFIHDVFSPLWSDENRHGDLEKTLLTYIDMNRSATQTAKKLHIHINTFYQRLRKIEDLLQLKLNDAEDVLKIQLACHLQSTYTQ